MPIRIAGKPGGLGKQPLWLQPLILPERAGLYPLLAWPLYPPWDEPVLGERTLENRLKSHRRLWNVCSGAGYRMDFAELWLKKAVNPWFE